MKKQLQYGFAHLGLLLVLAVAVVIALVGYKVASNNTKPVGDGATATTQSVSRIRTAGDLDKVKATLNNTNLDGDLNPSSLNQDVQSLL